MSLEIVAEMERGKDIPGLIIALQHQDARVRQAAAEALGRVGDGRAKDPLRQALQDGDPLVRDRAQQALNLLQARGLLPDLEYVSEIAASMADSLKAVKLDQRDAPRGNVPAGQQPGSKGNGRQAGGYIMKRLVPGEKIIYRAPRNWSRLAGNLFGILFALALGLAYLFFSYWQQSVIDLSRLSRWASQNNAYLAQGIGWLRLGVLALGVFMLFFGLVQLGACLGHAVALTDRRVLGRVGRNILRRIDIPLDEIAWVDFPNHIISKGPLQIHTRSGKSATLWDLARPGVFLGHLEAAYPPAQRPVIHKKTKWGQVILVLLGLATLITVMYALYTMGTFDRWL